MIYNAKNGYGLKLLGFDEQYTDCIIYRPTKREIIELADKLIITFTKRSLMERLNEMQASGENVDLFANKFEIPNYFINLILKDYGMKILGE